LAGELDAVEAAELPAVLPVEGSATKCSIESSTGPKEINAVEAATGRCKDPMLAVSTP
jgi:hypothetical protein